MLIKDIVKILTDAGIEENEANIEVKLLLENLANYTITDIIMGNKLTDDKLEIVKEKAMLRAKTRQPIQYIIGKADFMGEKYIVNPSVLIPRDETEILTSKAIELIRENNFQKVLDMCCGSGCIACTIAKQTPATVLGTDISLEALKTAFSNMENLELFNKATFRKSDIFSKIREDETFDIIVSNPPYIAPKFKENIQKEVTFEPEIALYTTDEEGLEFYEKITKDAPKFLNNNGYLLFELGINQSKQVKSLLNNNGFINIEIIKDLAGIDRVILGQISK